MHVILGSQSPRRRELLLQILPAEQLAILPPRSADEPGFDGLHSVKEIERQLVHVAQQKLDDVVLQLQKQQQPLADCCVVCADTIVVANESDGPPVVLGKPPADNWQPCVRDWFRRYYSGRAHEVWTGCLISSVDEVREIVVKTRVSMCAISDELIDWYVSTEEPIGKAGGYGIQGAAAMLVDAVEGSLTNVIGLPLREVSLSLSAIGK